MVKSLEDKVWPVIIVVAIAWLVIGSFAAIDLSVSSGSFRGKVIDAEYTGLIWKNHVFHVQRTYTDTLNFTICKDRPDAQAMFDTVLKSQQDGKEVIVDYQDKFFYWAWECNTGATPVLRVTEAN